jgi:RND family efflux transporter MFP subunit
VATKTLRSMLPLILIIGSIAIAAILFANRPQNVIAPFEAKPLLVDVAEVFLQDLRIPIQAQGTVSPHRQTTVVSEVGGKIISVSPSFAAGGFIGEGDVLARVDDRDYQANLLRAKASVETVESTLAQEKGRAEVAFKEWKKQPKNTQRSQDATDLYLRKPQLEQAQAQLLSAQADLTKAGDDLDRTIIRAPYDSLIKEKRADLGQYITPGTALAEVFAVDFAEVRLAIPQSKLSYLDLPGVSGFDEESAPLVDLYTNIAGDVTHWTAHLQRTEGVVDERSRVLYAVARINDPYALKVGDHKPLRVGTFVKANILGKETRDLVVLPRRVLRAGNRIWVVDDQMTLRNRVVTTLRTGGSEIYVTAGLQSGELVCLSNPTGAIPGTAVTINKRISTLRQQEAILEAAGAPPLTTQQQKAGDETRGPDQTSSDNTNEVSREAA